MNCPLISILVPIYGVEKYIKRCAESLLEQTYRNIEYIFINDCTKDKSIEILKEVIRCYPDRNGQIKIINHERNRGLAAARNTAIENAQGDFILHVDSDDYVAKDIVEKLVERQIETDADLVCSDLYRCTKKENVLVKYPYDEKKENFIRNIFTGKQESWIWGKLIRKKLYTDNNIKVEEGCNMAEDFQVLPRLAYFSNGIAYVKEPMYFYELSNTSSYCKRVSENQKKQQWRSFDINYVFFEKTDLKRDLEYCAADMTYYHMKQFAKFEELSCDYFQALKCRWKGLSLDVKRSLSWKKRFFVSFCVFCSPLTVKKLGKIIWFKSR